MKTLIPSPTAGDTPRLTTPPPRHEPRAPFPPQCRQAQSPPKARFGQRLGWGGSMLSGGPQGDGRKTSFFFYNVSKFFFSI